MSTVAAYFDLDGTLLDASSEKTLTAALTKRRPWRMPLAATAWSLRFIGSICLGRSVYDSARNRGHFTLSNWQYLRDLADELVENKLSKRVTQQALDCLEWHRSQGHRLVLVTATINPMAQAMGKFLNMDTIYGCGPENQEGTLSGSEKGWSVPRRKGKVPIVLKDAQENGHDVTQCYGYGNTYADSFFMRELGNPVSINAEGPLKKFSQENGWPMHEWRIDQPRFGCD